MEIGRNSLWNNAFHSSNISQMITVWLITAVWLSAAVAGLSLTELYVSAVLAPLGLQSSYSAWVHVGEHQQPCQGSGFMSQQSLPTQKHTQGGTLEVRNKHPPLNLTFSTTELLWIKQVFITKGYHLIYCKFLLCLITSQWKCIFSVFYCVNM